MTLCSFSVSGIKMAGGKQNKLSREEELLLQDFSRNVSTKSSALFYGNALIVSTIPICKFIAICKLSVNSFFYARCVVQPVGPVSSFVLLLLTWKNAQIPRSRSRFLSLD